MAVLVSGVVSWWSQKLAQELEIYLHMQQRLEQWLVLFFWSSTLFRKGRITCLPPVAHYLCSESSLLLFTLGSYYFTQRLFLGVGLGFAVPCCPKTLSFLPLIPLCSVCQLELVVRLKLECTQGSPRELLKNAHSSPAARILILSTRGEALSLLCEEH